MQVHPGIADLHAFLAFEVIRMFHRLNCLKVRTSLPIHGNNFADRQADCINAARHGLVSGVAPLPLVFLLPSSRVGCHVAGFVEAAIAISVDWQNDRILLFRLCCSERQPVAVLVRFATVDCSLAPEECCMSARDLAGDLERFSLPVALFVRVVAAEIAAAAE